MLSKIKNLLSISGADFLGASISGIFWFILATLISPEKFGEIHYFLGIAGLAYGISLIGSSDVISVYVAKKMQLQSTISLISLISGAISAIVVIVLFTRGDVSFILIGYIINESFQRNFNISRKSSVWHFCKQNCLARPLVHPSDYPLRTSCNSYFYPRRIC